MATAIITHAYHRRLNDWHLRLSICSQALIHISALSNEDLSPGLGAMLHLAVHHLDGLVDSCPFPERSDLSELPTEEAQDFSDLSEVVG